MDLGLKGKVALVGGSSKGIGRAIAMALGREGASITICSRDNAALAEAAEMIRTETQADVLYVVCDMASYDDIKRAVSETILRYGRLDILVNNAGGPPAGLFEDFDEAEWAHAIDQNLLSAVRAIRESLPHLKRSGSGRIINVTSVAVKQPIDRLILSNTTRLGVVGLAKTLSRELGRDGITVNNICPGNIASQRLMSLIEDRARRQGMALDRAMEIEESRVPLGFLGEPDDVGNLAAFLCSDKARYITGATIQVDGGSTLSVF